MGGEGAGGSEQGQLAPTPPQTPHPTARASPGAFALLDSRCPLRARVPASPGLLLTDALLLHCSSWPPDERDWPRQAWGTCGWRQVKARGQKGQEKRPHALHGQRV